MFATDPKKREEAKGKTLLLKVYLIGFSRSSNRNLRKHENERVELLDVNQSQGFLSYLIKI